MKSTLVLLAIVPIILVAIFRSTLQVRNENEKVVKKLESRSKITLLTKILSNENVCVDSLKKIDLTQIKKSPVIIKDKDWIILGKPLSNLFNPNSNNATNIYIYYIEEVSDSSYKVGFSIKTDQKEYLVKNTHFNIEIEENSAKEVVGCKVNQEFLDDGLEVKDRINILYKERKCRNQSGNKINDNIKLEVNVKKLSNSSYEVNSCFHDVTIDESIYCTTRTIKAGEKDISQTVYTDPNYSDDITLRVVNQVSKVGVQSAVSFVSSNPIHNSCHINDHFYWVNIKK